MMKNMQNSQFHTRKKYARFSMVCRSAPVPEGNPRSIIVCLMLIVYHKLRYLSKLLNILMYTIQLIHGQLIAF